jgi:hypothetical protein
MTSLNPRPQLVDGVNVDAVARAVRSCPGVDDLATGALGSVATYLPGRTVAGVAVAQDHVTIQLRSRWGVPTDTVAGQVRSAVAALVGLRRVDIVVADIAAPSHTEPRQADRGGAGPDALAITTAQTPAAPEAGQGSQPNSGQLAAPSSAPSIWPSAPTRPGS